jgi:cysteine-rich secretory family protein
LANSILAVHNSERAAVGVPPLLWSDKLAADAKPWAEHLATTTEFAHDPTASSKGEGENLAGFITSVSETGGGETLWVNEKANWHGGLFVAGAGTGHYTQMVWRDTKEVGCATASGGGHPFSILVCRYSPQGNIIGQKPF